MLRSCTRRMSRASVVTLHNDPLTADVHWHARELTSETLC